jgi:shikimate kinase
MGAGKSTIGRGLASRLQYSFCDSDAVIESRTGADIPWIFDVEGEEGFRARETAVLKELVQNHQQVIATGGGIVLKAENREYLKRGGVVIYLTASLDQLVQRTAKDRKRPLLQVANPRARLQQIVEERDPLYRSVADHVLVTDGRGPKAVVQEIIGLLHAVKS